MDREKLLAQYGQLTLQAKMIAQQMAQIEQVLLTKPETKNDSKSGDKDSGNGK